MIPPFSRICKSVFFNSRIYLVPGVTCRDFERSLDMPIMFSPTDGNVGNIITSGPMASEAEVSRNMFTQRAKYC